MNDKAFTTPMYGKERYNTLVCIDLPLRDAIGSQKARILIQYDCKDKYIVICRQIWDSNYNSYYTPAYGSISFELKEFYHAVEAILKARKILNML